MKVLLINPEWNTSAGIWKGVHSVFPPVGLLSIASVLEKAGHKVRIWDLNVEFWKDDYEPDIVGITITTATSNSGYTTSERAKEQWPNCHIIFGGVHVSVCSEEALLHCHTAIVGEGEGVIVDVVEKGLRGIVKGVPVDVNELPMPAYHLIDTKKYHPAVGGYRQLPAMLVVSSRGCPNFPPCNYCYQPFGGKIRQRNPELLFEDIRYLIEQKGIREISFYDDNFTTIKPNLLKFCELLTNYQKENKIRITWSCFARIDWLDEEKAIAMKKSGCHTILFGIESGNEHIREDVVHKHLNLDKAFEVNKMLKKIGIETRASFIFGLPEDTKETMQETIDVALKLDPDMASFNIICPNPNTEAYDWGVSNGYLEPNQWDNFDLASVVLKIPTATEQEIMDAYKTAHRRFYFRPKFIIKRLLKSFTIQGIKTNLNGLKAILKV